MNTGSNHSIDLNESWRAWTEWTSSIIVLCITRSVSLGRSLEKLNRYMAPMMPMTTGLYQSYVNMDMMVRFPNSASTVLNFHFQNAFLLLILDLTLTYSLTLYLNKYYIFIYNIIGYTYCVSRIFTHLALKTSPCFDQASQVRSRINLVSGNDSAPDRWYWGVHSNL